MIENRQISMSDIFCEQAEEQRKKDLLTETEKLWLIYQIFPNEPKSINSVKKVIWEGNNKGNIAYIEISVNSLLAKNEGFYTAEFDVERYFLNLKAERKYTAEELGLI